MALPKRERDDEPVKEPRVGIASLGNSIKNLGLLTKGALSSLGTSSGILNVSGADGSNDNPFQRLLSRAVKLLESIYASVNAQTAIQRQTLVVSEQRQREDRLEKPGLLSLSNVKDKDKKGKGGGILGALLGGGGLAGVIGFAVLFAKAAAPILARVAGPLLGAFIVKALSNWVANGGRDEFFEAVPGGDTAKPVLDDIHDTVHGGFEALQRGADAVTNSLGLPPLPIATPDKDKPSESKPAPSSDKPPRLIDRPKIEGGGPKPSEETQRAQEFVDRSFDMANSMAETLMRPGGSGRKGYEPASKIPKKVAHDKAFQKEVTRVSKKYGLREEDLYTLIKIETGGSYDPKRENDAGSGATGLIQFMTGYNKEGKPWWSTKKGYTKRKLKSMSRAEQMKVVDEYFHDHNLPQGARAGDLYAIVAAPFAKPSRSLGKYNDTIYKEGTAAYRQNPGWDYNNDGRITKQDLHNLMKKSWAKENTVPATHVSTSRTRNIEPPKPKAKGEPPLQKITTQGAAAGRSTDDRRSVPSPSRGSRGLDYLYYYIGKITKY